MTERITWTRTAAVVVALLAFALLVPPSLASAASLRVRAGVLTALSAHRCDDAIAIQPRAGQGVLAQGTTTLFQASDVAKSCAGRRLTVTIFRSSGAPLGTAGANIPQSFTGGTVNLTTTAAVFVPEVAGVAATIGTWGVATSWSVPGDALPLVICRTSSGAACTPSVSDSGNSTEVRVQLRRGGLFFDWYHQDTLYLNMSHSTWGALGTSATVTGGTEGVVVNSWSCASNILSVRVVDGYWLTAVTVTSSATAPPGALTCSAP